MSNFLRDDRNPILVRRDDTLQAEQLGMQPETAASLRSDVENASLLEHFDSDGISDFDPNDIMLQTLSRQRDELIAAGVLPDEPDLPDLFGDDEQNQSPVASIIKHPPMVQASASLLENEYAFTQYIKGLIPMAIVDERLYLFQAPCYRLLSDQAIITEIKAALQQDLRRDVAMSFLKRTITQLKTEKDLQIDLHDVEYDPYDVIFADGIYNVKDQTMRDGRPADYYITANAVKFRPKKYKRIKANVAERAVVDDFFEQASGGDKEIERLIWTTLGVMLSTEAKFKAFFYLYGPPDTGKSLFGTLVTRLIGTENCANIMLNEVGAKYHCAELQGKLANISLDQPSVIIKDIGLFKQLTSGGSDVVTAEKKFGALGRLESRFIKFLFAGNHLPRLRETDDAFWSRMVLVPFENQIKREERDPDLLDKLLKRSDYIIGRALKHYRKFLDDNMRFPACHRSEELKNGFVPVSSNEKVRMFVDECCEFVPNAQATTHELFESYCNFCRQNGYSSGTLKAFSLILKNEFPLETFRANSQRGYRGIRMK